MSLLSAWTGSYLEACLVLGAEALGVQKKRKKKLQVPLRSKVILHLSAII